MSDSEALYGLPLLKEQLATFPKFIGATTLEAAFVNWGTRDWPEDGNTELRLKLRLVDGTVTEVSLGVDLAQQSIILRDREAGPSIAYKELPDYIAIWRQFDVKPELMEEHDWIAFDLADCREHKRIIGDTVQSIELQCCPEDFTQLGMIITWSCGHSLTITTYGDGCTVLPGAHYRNFFDVVRIVIDENTVTHSRSDNDPS